MIGVTPQGFQGTALGLSFDLWFPATLAPDILPGSRELTERNSRGYEAVFNIVTPGYFGLMGIPFVSGVDFTDLKNTAAPRQAIVNDEFVRRYLSGLEPTGRQIESRGRAYTIAGVVRTSLSNAFGEPPTAAVYYSYRDPITSATIAPSRRSGRSMARQRRSRSTSCRRTTTSPRRAARSSSCISRKG